MEKLLVLDCYEFLGADESVFESKLEIFYSGVIAALEQHSEIKAHIYLSGIFLELLEKTKDQLVFPKIIDFAKHERIKILPGLFYEPDLSKVDQQSAQIHFDLSKDYWSRKGITTDSSIFIPQKIYISWFDDFIRLNEIKYIFCPSGENGLVLSFVGEKNWKINFYFDLITMLNKSVSRQEQILRRDVLMLTRQILDNFTPLEHSEKCSDLSTVFNQFSPTVYTNYILLQSRINELQKELQPFLMQEKIIANEDRFKRAKRFFAQAQANFISRITGESILGNIQSYQAYYRSIISAQVELDALNNPEVDPSVGWLSYSTRDFDQDGQEEIVIDTHLIRCYIKSKQNGSILELDYKPRKFNLCNGLSSIDYIGDFKEESINNFDHKKTTLISKTLDLVCINFSSEAKDFNLTLMKSITFKAGIGAHLNNSTTGFSIESWLEGNNSSPENIYFISSWDLLFSSGVPNALNAKSLISVGGVGNEMFSLDKPQVFDINNSPGGLHGLRFIDGVDGFVVDFRTSKQLNMISSTPLKINGLYQGVRVKFYIEARRIYGETKSSTLFISIV